MTTLDDRRIIKPAPERGDLIELRGQSGRLYGMFDPRTMTIEFRVKRDEPAERIDLKPYLELPRP